MARYETELARLCAAVDGATLHSGYVSDELFDRWIVASDVVVLPYRNIWSSGVMERAGLFKRPVIATRVGGLAEQAAAQGDVQLVDDDAQLRAAMIERLPAGKDVPVDSWVEDRQQDGPTLRAALQAQVRQRAARSPLGRASALPAALPRDTVPPASSAPLRRLPRLGGPDTNHRRRSVRLVKRAVRKVTAFEIDPLVQQVNDLQAATVAALHQDVTPTSAEGRRTG
jgi:hypothetical protein